MTLHQDKGYAVLPGFAPMDGSTAGIFGDPDYGVEYAKSSRSTCRKCLDVIEKGGRCDYS